MLKHNYIRRFLSIGLMMLGFAATAISQETITYDFGHHGENGIQLTGQTDGNAAIEFNIDQMTLTSFTYDGEMMQSIGMAGLSLPNAKGHPNIPSYSRYIAIPQGAEAVLHVVSYEQQVIHNVNVEPSLGIQPEDAEPDMNYTKDNKVYSQDAFYPAEFATISEPTSLRGVDVVTVSISPVRFNPVTKEAIVYHKIVVEVEYVGGKSHFGDDRLRSPYWDPILAQNILNFNVLPVIDYEARMQQWLRDGAEGAEYLIVIPNNSDFEEPAERIKEYRIQQGIITEVVRLDEIPATTTAQMKTYFHNAYNNWDVAPVAVMLLGDHNTNMAQGIPAETVSHDYSGSCITDNQYADVTGDHLPEMVFSRLVAANGTEAAMMVDKQIEYEFTNPNMDANSYNIPVTALGWQTQRWFQLCSEVVGGYFRAHGKNPMRINCIYEGTPGSQWSTATNTQQVVNYFGPNGTGYIPQTPSELGGFTGGTPAQINVAINEGTMLVQHRDHGLEEGWGEPAYRSNHVQQLTNVGKMPFVMSINCLTGKFNNSTPCFAETFMRHTYNGQNAGAVGILCPTEVSYSFVNDAFVWGVYDQFQPDFMPDYGPYAPQQGNWQPAFGNVAGKYFLAQSSWPYNTENKDITYQMFTAHCDAFLRLYSEVPQTMTVDHQNVQIAGLQTFQITAPEGAKIALTKGEGEDLEIIAVAEATGSMQNVEIPSQVPPTIMKLTVTGQNYLRYQADIEVIPAEGPYIVIDSYELSNGATQLNFGDEAGLDLVFKNVGSEVAPAGTASISSESEYVTITSESTTFDAIPSNTTLDLDEAFSFTIADNVPNNVILPFTITIESGEDLQIIDITLSVYTNNIRMRVYAPVFEIGNVTIEEINGNGNGRLDPGETAKLTFPIENNGGANSNAVDATLVINNDYMQIVCDPTVTLESIEGDGTATVEYTIYVGGAPTGFAAEYTLDVESGAYTATKDFVSKIGLNVEDFESGELDPDLWTNSASYPWTFSTENPYEGIYCLKSGSIGNNATTDISLLYESAEADSISFYYRVSSESGYDKMSFYINNVKKGEWSGEVGWTKAQYAVTAGRHIFKWQYKKDYSSTGGSDCCWIDYVILPRDRSMTVSAGFDKVVCDGETTTLNGSATNHNTLEWTTSGDGTFSDVTIMTPEYTPGTEDLSIGEVTLTLTAVSMSSDTLSDDVTLTFEELPTPAQPTGETFVVMDVTPTTQYTVEPNEEFTSYEWIIEPEEAGTLEADGNSVVVTWNSGTSGEVNIFVIGKDSYCESESSEPITVLTSLTSTVEAGKSAVSIYPNPTDGTIRIAMDEPTTDANIVIYNVLGSVVYSKTISDGNGIKTDIDLGNIPEGTYFIAINNNGSIIMDKIVVKR